MGEVIYDKRVELDGLTRRRICSQLDEYASDMKLLTSKLASDFDAAANNERNYYWIRKAFALTDDEYDVFTNAAEWNFAGLDESDFLSSAIVMACPEKCEAGLPEDWFEDEVSACDFTEGDLAHHFNISKARDQVFAMLHARGYAEGVKAVLDRRGGQAPTYFRSRKPPHVITKAKP